jgi:histidinol-phosphate aminotransferase
MKVSPNIIALDPYVPGKPIETLRRELGLTGSIVKLASNENPMGASKKAQAAIRAVVGKIFRYPDGAGYRLVEALAKKWAVSPDQVILGHGSDEVIELLVRTFLLPGDEAVMADPTFSCYRLMVTAGHGQPVTVPLVDGRHALSAMAKAITPKTRLIFICNPNNPTGTIVDEAEVTRFLARVPKRVLAVFDEAYAEYVTADAYPKMVRRVKGGDNVIFLRTFSKIYGLAGVRIGYGIGPADVVGHLNRMRQPFNTSLLAQEAALAALADTEHLTQSLAVNRAGMANLTRQFDALGIGYFPSHANFIHFHLDGPESIGAEVYDALLHHGVIIRHMGGPNLRVTIGRPSENRQFTRALKAVLRERMG